MFNRLLLVLLSVLNVICFATNHLNHAGDHDWEKINVHKTEIGHMNNHFHRSLSSLVEKSNLFNLYGESIEKSFNGLILTRDFGDRKFSIASSERNISSLFFIKSTSNILSRVAAEQSSQVDFNSLDQTIFQKLIRQSIPALISQPSLLFRESKIRRSTFTKQHDTLIVLTTCNQLKMTMMALQYLKETHSVADFLVVDDHSIDGTVDYLVKKGYAVITKNTAKGLTDSWNVGYQVAVELGYKNLVFTNNDVLVSRAGLLAMQQDLQTEVLMVPLTSMKGAGHNPSQSLTRAFRLPDAMGDYVSNFRHFEVLQSGLNLVCSSKTQRNPQDRRLPFDRTVPSTFRGQSKFNGFLFGLNLTGIGPAAVREGEELFDRGDLMVGQEDHLMARMKALNMTPAISLCAYMHHFKSVTVATATMRNLHSYQQQANDSQAVRYKSTERKFRIKLEKKVNSSGSSAGVTTEYMDIRDDLRFYHPEIIPSKPKSAAESGGKNSSSTSLLDPESYSDKSHILTYPELYHSYASLKVQSAPQVYPSLSEMVSLLTTGTTGSNVSYNVRSAAEVVATNRVVQQLTEKMVHGSRVVIGFAISDPVRTPSAGDIFTAQELGDALERSYNVEVRYLHRGVEWYAPSSLSSLDVLITMLDAYDLGKALAVVKDTQSVPPHHVLSGRSERWASKPSLVTIAWMRNWFQRWLTQPWLGNYDLLLTSSVTAQGFFQTIGAAIGFSTQCVMGCPKVTFGEPSSADPGLSRDLISRRLNVPVELLQLATNDLNFHNKNTSRSSKAAAGAVNSKYKADYVFTGSYHNAPRAVMSFDPATLPSFKGIIVGDNWQNPAAQVSAAWRKAAIGLVPYDQMPLVYASVKIVIDDANSVTMPWASVNSRVFDALAAGALIVSNGQLGFEEVFGVDLLASLGHPVIYHSGAELTKVLDYYLRNPSERNRAVNLMRSVVLRGHTYAKRANQMVKMLGRQLGVVVSDGGGRVTIKRAGNPARRHDISGIGPSAKVIQNELAVSKHEEVQTPAPPATRGASAVKKEGQVRRRRKNPSVSTANASSAKPRVSTPPAVTSTARLSPTAPSKTVAAVPVRSNTTSLCIGVRTIEAHRHWLEIQLRSFVLQFLESDFAAQVGLEVFVTNTDQDAEGDFHEQLKSIARNINTEYRVPVVHIVSDMDPFSSSAASPHLQRGFKNPFYGYDSTDLLVSHMVSLYADSVPNPLQTEVSRNSFPGECEWILLTNGDNLYNSAWFSTVVPKMLSPGTNAIAWDYVTHHKRGKDLTESQQQIVVEIKRGFVDLGSMLVRAQLYLENGALFLPQGVFSRDLYARDYFTFLTALKGDVQTGVEIVHRTLLFHQ